MSLQCEWQGEPQTFAPVTVAAQRLARVRVCGRA